MGGNDISLIASYQMLAFPPLESVENKSVVPVTSLPQEIQIFIYIFHIAFCILYPATTDLEVSSVLYFDTMLAT